MQANSISIFMLLLIPLFFLFGLAIWAVLIRTSIWVLRKSFSLDKTVAVPTSGNWSTAGNHDANTGAGSLRDASGIPTGQPAANPYSVSYAEVPSVSPAGYSVLPMPSFGRAMLIALVSMVLTFVVAFVLGLLLAMTGVVVADSIVIQLLNMVISFGMCVIVFHKMLPTTIGWAIGVVFSMILVYFLVCVVIALFVFVPLTFLAG